MNSSPVRSCFELDFLEEAYDLSLTSEVLVIE